MDHRLLAAIKLFSTSKSEGLSLGEKGELDASEIALAIFLKFIDVLEGVAIIIAGVFLMRFIKRYFQKTETTHERQRTALNLLEKITSGFILVVSFTLGLKVIGLDLTLIVSVLTLGLSFGLRDVIKNYVAGLLILFKAPFEIGDVVHIRKFTGKIEKIEAQAITIRTFDNKMITIHNSDLLTQPIINYSKTEQARLEISIPLGYGSDTSRALKIFDRILEAHTAVLKNPKYSIVFNSFGDHSISVLMRFWVQKPCNVLKVRSELALQIQEAFDEENLLAPYTREASLTQTFGMTDGRKARLQTFYGQPLLANIATATVEQIASAAGAPGAPATAPSEVYSDTEEPA